MDRVRSFERWCQYAAEYIKYRPDQKAVYEELYSHMEDKYDALVSSGLSPSDAEKLTVRAMGDSNEVGKALAKIHKPFWGYLVTFTKVLLVAAAVVLLFSVFNVGDHIYLSRDEWPPYKDGDMLHYPICSDKSDGYTFTVPMVSTWEYEYSGQDGEAVKGHTCYITVRSVNILPWEECVEFREFHAVDSDGNSYKTVYDSCFSDDKRIRGNYCRTGLFTHEYRAWLDGYEGAEWIELRYDREGRDIVLHIDLAKGVPYEEN